jgi:hypothetical protein
MISDEFPHELWALPLTVRCQNIFKRNGIQTIADLTKMTKFDLLMLPNLGRKSVQEIVEVLAERGLALSTGPEDCYHWLEKGKQINRQLKGLASMKEDTTPIDPTWMQKTGGFARDMTLHDYYAGVALHGMLSSGNLPKSVGDVELAHATQLMADAMLVVRKAK